MNFGLIAGRGPLEVQSLLVTEVRDRAAVLTEVSLLLAVLFLGTNPVAVQEAVAEVPPLPVVALRFVLAGLVVLVFARILEPGTGPGRRELLSMAGVGLVGGG